MHQGRVAERLVGLLPSVVRVRLTCMCGTHAQGACSCNVRSTATGGKLKGGHAVKRTARSGTVVGEMGRTRCVKVGEMK
jgi:hypothetical protein